LVVVLMPAEANYPAIDTDERRASSSYLLFYAFLTARESKMTTVFQKR
jgi:hypothetical protein